MSRSNRVTIFATASLLLMLSGPSQAFFVAQKDVPEAKPSFDMAGTHHVVTQVGIGDAEKMAGFANGLPVGESIAMILPEGWTYVADPTVNLLAASPSWKSEGPWDATLQEFGRKSGLRFLVDWEKKKVFVAKDDMAKPVSLASLDKETPAGDTQEAANAESAQPEQTVTDKLNADKPDTDNSADTSESTLSQKPKTESGQPVEVATPQAPPVVPKWILAPGGIKDQLAVWAQQADYQLVWSAPYDCVIETHAEFSGDFIQAMNTLVEQLAANGAKLRIYVYKANSVVLVKGE